MKRLIGQLIYAGPNIPQIGLQYGMIFSNGIWDHYYNFIETCPSLGELFVPIDRYAVVRRELNFDLGRNMRGKHGKYVEFYRAVQQWLASKQTKPSTSGVKIKTHG